MTRLLTCSDGVLALSVKTCEEWVPTTPHLVDIPRSLCLAGRYTNDFSRVVFQFPPREKQQRFLDTIDFSRVEVQSRLTLHRRRRPKLETPHD